MIYEAYKLGANSYAFQKQFRKLKSGMKKLYQISCMLQGTSDDNFDSEKCLFCQPKDADKEETTKKGRKKKGQKSSSKCSEQLNNIETMSASDKVIYLSQLDSVMRYRMAGVTDLIAYEGKYHLTCYTAFLRKYDVNNEYVPGKQHDFEKIAFDNTMQELKEGLIRRITSITRQLYGIDIVNS